MIRYYLTQLSIEGFRGINNEGQPLELRFDQDKVNSIFANNGLGKSSIYDTLSYAIHGKIPKLEQLEQSEDPQSYVNNRFHALKTAKIELVFAADDGSGTTTIQIERAEDGTRAVTSNDTSDPDAFLAALQSDFVLLDQETFARFIHDKSLDRGRRFSRLLGLSRLSDYRVTLSKLANAGNIENDFELPSLRANQKNWSEQLSTLITRLRAAYDQITGQPYSGQLDPVSYSAELLSSLKQIPTLTPFCDVASLDELKFTEIEAAIAAAEKNKERDQLVKFREDKAKLDALAPQTGEEEAQQTLKTEIDQRDAALLATSGSLLQNNFRTAVAVLESEAWEDPRQCPTCDTTLPTSLLETLQGKLSAYDLAEKSVAGIKTNWRNAIWGNRWRDLEANELVKPSGESRDYVRLSPSFTNGSVSTEQFEEARRSLQQLEQQRVAAIEKLETQIDALEKSLPASMVQVTTQLSTAKQAALDLAEYGTLCPKIKLVEWRIARREAWQEFINIASRDFAAAESTWVTNRQLAIDSDYQEMHATITRNKDVVPSLVRSTNSERLRLGLDHFYGLTGLSANTLLQESYCNSIAISAFLSTALLCPTPARFLVLDDITSTFDGGHQYNLMEMLRTKVLPTAAANGLQIILLTHDTLLEKYLDKANHTGTWRHQKLIGTPPNGPVLTEQHNKDRIRQRAADYLTAGQTEAGAPWIRQYLEAILSQIIRKTSIRVPLDYAMDDNKKMAQNAINAIGHEIALHDKAGDLILTSQQVADTQNTLVPSLVSNFLSHYNTATYSGLSAHVLLGVLDDVDSLAECFKYDCTCRNPGTTVRRYYRSLTAKDCNC